MLAKVEQEVIIPTIATITLSSISIKVCQDLNVPLADTGTTFPKVVVFIIVVSLTIIIPINLLEVTISIATLEPSKATPIDPQVLINVFPIIPIAKAIPTTSTQELIQTSLDAQT